MIKHLTMSEAKKAWDTAIDQTVKIAGGYKPKFKGFYEYWKSVEIQKKSPKN